MPLRAEELSRRLERAAELRLGLHRTTRKLREGGLLLAAYGAARETPDADLR